MGDAIQSFPPLPLSSHFAFNLSQHQVFFNESALCIRWLKYWSFSISPSNEYLGLFPLGLTGLISLQSKGLSRVFSSTIIQKHQFFGTQPFLWSSSHPYMTTGKTIALTIETFVSKVMSLLWTVQTKDFYN